VLARFGADPTTVIRLHRHRLGPRVFVLGRRVHEWHLGLSVLALVGAGVALDAWHLTLVPAIAGAVGIWLVAKDWQDVVPSRRDTAAWRIGLHRRTAPLRAIRRGDGLPSLAAAIAFAVGLVNLVSALTPTIAWRHHLLLQLEPMEAVPVFHTLAVPASIALVVVAFYLRARRHRAWQVAIGLMLALAAIQLLKGLDFEEAALSLGAAGLLWWGRDAFYVRHLPLRAAPPAVIALVAVAAGCATLAAWTISSDQLPDELAWQPLLVGGLGLAAILTLTVLLFRPLGSPKELPCDEERSAAADLVRSHGWDTLAFFKLRRDAHYCFSGDGRAFLGYRVANGVMLVSGDPVGPDDALPGLVQESCAFAETRGLRFAALGASERVLGLYRHAGMRAMYLGDEAIVDTGTFSLEGRAIRRVRQSVHRLEAAGYRVEAVDVDEIDDRTLGEIEDVSARWRDGAAERGFSMAMDSLRGEHQAGSVVVAARDAEGVMRGFIHFVPSYGRPAMSLSLMRRDRETPNGLMEFLVVRSIDALKERGVAEISLNFATFGRWLQRPEGRGERLLGKGIALANPFFQIESLHRFNAKFAPRWEPRYLVYEHRRSLARVGLAAMRIEGQLPKLR
jgi:lysyl-tRNA synthetase class 2